MTGLARYWCRRLWLWLMPLCLLVPGCSPKPSVPSLPPPPQETLVAKVAVPVPCEVQHVPVPEYPLDHITHEDEGDIYTLAGALLADLRVRMAESERLRAANTSPCKETALDPLPSDRR